MKYLKLFANHEAYNSAKDGLALPNVSLCVQENEVHYNPVIPQHEYVDLGLPSGTLWATMSVGATSVTDYGNYYKYGLGAAQYDVSQSDYTTTENPLAASADTAVQVWGGDWYMPTKTQLEELTANTTWQWVSDYQGSGINGVTFTAEDGSGNVLFIPASGTYSRGEIVESGETGHIWSSTPYDGTYSYYLYFYNNEMGVGKGVSFSGRFCGYPVRPVKDGE